MLPRQRHPPPAVAGTTARNDKAVGHTQALPAQPGVTTAGSKVDETATPVNPPAAPTAAAARPRVDFAFLRERISMEGVLRQLGLFAELRGRGSQLRGCCPLHSPAGAKERTFSVHLGKHVFQCFQAECGAHGNVLDLWAAVHGLPLYEAALHRAATFGLRRNREEEPVGGTRWPSARRGEKKGRHHDGRPLTFDGTSFSLGPIRRDFPRFPDGG
jgi:hypothetical protein